MNKLTNPRQNTKQELMKMIIYHFEFIAIANRFGI